MPHRDKDENREKATAAVVTSLRAGLRLEELRHLRGQDVNGSEGDENAR